MEASSPLNRGEKNWNIFDSYLVDCFEYKIQINEDGGIPGLKSARKLFVGIHEDGNILAFEEKKGSDPSLLVIPLRVSKPVNTSELVLILKTILSRNS
jgi:hypothetical protein